MNIHESMISLVGDTPLVKLNSTAEGCVATVAAKLEFFNPCSSIKDRIGVSMIEEAEKRGDLKRGAVVVEPTSGNTGVGLAFVCAVKGYKLILTMPESMSQERKDLLKGFGAELVLTSAPKGMTGAINKAREIAEENPGSFLPMQFANPDNPKAHRTGTAEEIWRDTDGKIDIFVCGVGTGGTITGVGSILKKYNPAIRIVAVEPSKSPVLSGGAPAPHGIQGIGAGFVPEVLQTDVIDEIFKVDDADALGMGRRLMQEEGILCGISAGAAAHAAVEIAKREENKDKLVVFIVPDTGERYLSTALFQD
ncbi:cysteine synthase A [Maridesulfovibrio ferrireducens]|uniref:cysteine synthase A n=1 Tax=Maridesulfovibrio ferrireducens TaxID=246191 RepID=UPI001A22CBAF|nr:cysteine synthase A [Maridesulfovibrio ferrireducens]MBI9111998.1 cysteine synthase A [Maridesulfovibrio ferrireducens]